MTASQDLWNASFRHSLFERLGAVAAYQGAAVQFSSRPAGPGQVEHIASFERRVAGFSLGTRHGSILAPYGPDLPRLSRLAIDHLRDSAGVDQARFKVGFPGIQGTASETTIALDGFDVRLKTIEHPEILLLAADFGSFLSALSRNARSNIRKCHRRAADAGLRFEFVLGGEAVDVASLRVLARHNMEGRRTLAPYRAFLAYRPERGQNFQAALYSKAGELIGIACGAVDGATATMFMQSNHGGHRDLSPSLTLRSKLIERLIHQGVRSLVFVDGCGGTLRSACKPSLTGCLTVTPRAPALRLRRAVVGAAARKARQLSDAAAILARELDPRLRRPVSFSETA